MDANARTPFTALVLAASRSPDDPVSREAGVANKCLADVNGRPMLLRVLGALADSGCVDRVFVSTNDPAPMLDMPEIGSRVQSGAIALLESGTSASDSVARAAREIDAPFPLLVTTGDHALLTGEMVRFFCARAARGGADMTVGLATASTIQSRFPETSRTYLRFRDDRYSGCNLFALMSPEAVRVVEFWSGVEKHRKTPFRLIRAFGPAALILFALGALTLRRALGLASRRLGAAIAPVIMPQPEAAIDVDKPADLALAARILAARGRQAGADDARS